MPPFNGVLLFMLGLLAGFWIGVQIDIKQRRRVRSIKLNRFADQQFSKTALPLRSMLWRQIWQPNLFIPLPADEIIDEIADMLDEDDQPDFFKALDEFKKSRAVGPMKGDYCEVHYSEENVAEIRRAIGTGSQRTVAPSVRPFDQATSLHVRESCEKMTAIGRYSQSVNRP